MTSTLVREAALVCQTGPQSADGTAADIGNGVVLGRQPFQPSGFAHAAGAASTRTGDGVVIDKMRDAGPTLIEIEEQGDWRDGQWRDFDAVRAPRNVVALEGNPNYPT